MSKEIVDWKSALVADAKKTQVAESTGGNFISLKGGRMTYQEQTVPNDQLECIVVANVHERTMYDRPYDPDDTGPPDCFAQATDAGDLVPHPNVPNPVHPTCRGCPKAEFGTAKQGKGPACKTYRKLALMPADADPASAELAIMRVPPTSVRNFSQYASKVAGATGLPPWGVDTTVGVKPDAKTQFQVTFDGSKPVGDETKLAAIFGSIDSAEQMLMTPYDYEEKQDKPKASSKY